MASIIRCYLYNKELSKSDVVYKTPNCCKFSFYLGINDFKNTQTRSLVLLSSSSVFHFRPRLFHDVKWSVLQLCGTTWTKTHNDKFLIGSFYDQTAHRRLASLSFVSQITWNNRELIRETRSCIFR